MCGEIFKGNPRSKRERSLKDGDKKTKSRTGGKRGEIDPIQAEMNDILSGKNAQDKPGIVDVLPAKILAKGDGEDIESDAKEVAIDFKDKKDISENKNAENVKPAISIEKNNSHKKISEEYPEEKIYRNRSGEEIEIVKYNPKKYLVAINLLRGNGEKQYAEFSQDDFERVIRNYRLKEDGLEEKNGKNEIFERSDKNSNNPGDEKLKTMEEVERERAKKADEKIAEAFAEEKNTPETEAEKKLPIAGQEKPLEEKDAGKGEAINFKEEIEKVTKEVEDARIKYAKEEYGTFNIVSKIKNILGIKYDSQKVDTVDRHHKQYKIKLNELLNLRLEELKNRGLSGDELKKEMGDLIRYFNFEEKTNLYDAHTFARGKVIEEKVGKAPGWFVDKANKYARFRKKLGFFGNTAIGVGGVMLGLAPITRILGGVATGIGTTGVIEAKQRKKSAKSAEVDKEKMLSNFENSEEKFQFLMEKMQSEIDSYEKNLKAEKKKAFIRKGIGAAVAVFVGSGAFSDFVKWSGEKTGISHLVMEKLGLGIDQEEVPSAKGGGAVEKSIAVEVPPGGAVAEVAEKNIPLPEIERGSGAGIESSIRDYLRANPDLVEKYNNSSLSGGRKFSAGEIAARMFNDYPDKHDLIQSGHVELSPDGLSIKAIVSEDPLGYLPKEEITAPESFSDPGEIPAETPAPEAADNPAGNWADSRAKVEYVDEIKTNADSFFGRNSAGILQDLDSQIAGNTEELSRSYMHSNEGLEAIRERIADLGYSRGFLEKFSNSVLNGNQNEAVKSFRNAITLNENWETVKNMNFREAASQMNWRAGDKIKNILKILGSSIGDEAKPRGAETLGRWTERVAKLAIEKAK